MPKFMKKIVSIEGEAKPILEALSKAFPDSKTLRNILKIGDEKNGIGNIIVLNLVKAVELIADKSWGSKAVELPEELHLTHAKHAEDIFSEYQDYLNELLKQTSDQGKFLFKKDFLQLCTEEKIDNRFILVREILRRLVALALSNQVSSGEDGQTLIAGLENFITNIIQRGLLNINKEVLSTFADHLAGSHDTWVENFREIVDSARKLNIFADTMERTRKYLRMRETQIKIFLTITLNPMISPKLLTEDLISTQLKEAENSINQSARKKSKKIKQSSQVLDKNPSDEQQTPSAQTMKNLSILEWKESTKEEVFKLYALLKDTTLLINTIDSIENAHKGLGWLPVISGVFNFSGLSRVITDYHSCCIPLLNRDKFKKTQFSTTLAVIMVSDKKLSSFEGCIGGFSILENDRLHKIIKEHIEKTFKGLKSFHDELSNGKLFDKSYSLINMKNAKKLGLLVDEIIIVNDEVNDHKKVIADKNILEEENIKLADSSQYDFILTSVAVGMEAKRMEKIAAGFSCKHQYPVLIKNGTIYYAYGNTLGNQWNLTIIDSKCFPFSLKFPGVGSSVIIKANNITNPTLNPLYQEIRSKKAHTHLLEISDITLDKMIQDRSDKIIEWEYQHWTIGNWFAGISGVIGSLANVSRPFIFSSSGVLIRMLAGGGLGGGVGLMAGLGVGRGVQKLTAGDADTLKKEQKEFQDELKKRFNQIKAENCKLNEQIKALESNGFAKNEHSIEGKDSTGLDKNNYQVSKVSNNPNILSHKPKEATPSKKSENQDNFAQCWRTK